MGMLGGLRMVAVPVAHAVSGVDEIQMGIYLEQMERRGLQRRE